MNAKIFFAFTITTRRLNLKNRILKFCLSSFSAFLADCLIYSVMLYILSDSALMILVSNVTARVISASFNYFLNRRFVFGAEKSARSAASYFLLALFILALNNAVLELLTQVIHIYALPAKLITEMLLFSVSWLVQSRVIFRKKGDVEKCREENLKGQQ